MRISDWSSDVCSSDLMDYSQIILDKADGIATITLNRPEKLNAYTRAMQGEICAAMDDIDADDAVRAVIFTGAGNRAFCAGADLTPEGGGPVFSDPAEVAALSDPPVRAGGGQPYGRASWRERVCQNGR